MGQEIGRVNITSKSPKHERVRIQPLLLVRAPASSVVGLRLVPLLTLVDFIPTLHFTSTTALFWHQDPTKLSLQVHRFSFLLASDTRFCQAGHAVVTKLNYYLLRGEYFLSIPNDF